MFTKCSILSKKFQTCCYAIVQYYYCCTMYQTAIACIDSDQRRHLCKNLPSLTSRGWIYCNSQREALMSSLAVMTMPVGKKEFNAKT